MNMDRLFELNLDSDLRIGNVYSRREHDLTLVDFSTHNTYYMYMIID